MEYEKIGNYVDLKQGMAINSKSNYLVSDVETSLPLLRIADMPTKRRVIFMSENTPKRFWAEPEDIIYTRTGQVGLVFRNQFGVVHNNCFRVQILDKKKLDKGYLYWALQLKSIYEYANSIAAGVAQPDLPHKSFKSIKIPMNEIEKQKKIAQILDGYESLIELNNKRIKILEQTVEEIYKEWFVRFRFPGYENYTFIDGIPNKWQFKTIRDICSYVRGVSYSSDEIEGNNYPCLLINLKNIRDYGGIRKENCKTYNGSYKTNQVVKKHDLVMAVTEMVQERRIIGYVALIPSYKKKCVISADLVKINSDIDNIFLYSLFTFGGVSTCFSQYGNGTNVIHLKPSSLANVKVLIPDIISINKYVDIAKKIFDEIDLLEQKNEKLILQRDLLLPRLMSGKIEV